MLDSWRASERMREIDFCDVFANAPDAMFVLDLSGTIVHANRQASEFLGYEVDGLSGVSASDLLAPEHRDAGFTRLNDLRESRSGAPVKRVFIRRDGSRVPGEVFVSSLLDESGVPQWIVSAIRDASGSATSERMHAETAARMQALGSVASGVAHDFNNILATIAGFAELARAQVDSDSAIARDLDRSLRATQQAGQLVNQILSFGKQAAGSERPFDVEQSIVRIIRLIRTSLAGNVTLHLESDHARAPLYGDESRFQQIIMNLCTNAGRAIGDSGGTVVIHLRSDSECDPPEVVITVADDGPGIPSESREHIFDAFYSTRVGEVGTGLGLSLVKSITESFGGTVVLDDTERGASFTVRLPMFQGSEEEEPVVEIHTGRSGVGTVLVVDDDEAIVEILGRLLRRAGYTVMTTADPFEAVQLASTWRDDIRLILSDFRMPGMDGVSLLRQVRTDGSVAPAVILTAVRPDIEAVDAQSLGIHAIIGKPVDAAVLTQTVAEAIERAPLR